MLSKISYKTVGELQYAGKDFLAKNLLVRVQPYSVEVLLNSLRVNVFCFLIYLM